VRGEEGYYGLPAIKKPEWLWYIPAYFFTGGVASGTYIVATVADMAGREEDRAVVRTGRAVSLAALTVSLPLLIADLGRPERFHHMLRVFRPRSMMNQGAWGLTLFGAFAAAATLANLLERSPGRRSPLPLRALTWVGLVPAAYVGSYTGVLLSATNIPLWAGNRHFLGPLFFASALSSGISATVLATRLRGAAHPESEERLHRAESTTLRAELALTAASAAALGNLGKPLRSGRRARLFRYGALGLGMVAPLVLRKVAPNRPLARLLASALSLAGTAALKWSVTEAGMESADDPHAYFEYTRPDR
jgi:formate-dependent nitrite reductase membrane component NrfD